MRESRERHTDIETATAIVGTCPDMCPELERYFREETTQLSSLELTPDGKPDYHAMVKEYRRAGADQSEPLPHELRPGPVLTRTFDYLVCNVMDRPEKDPAITAEWYDFLWSRTRAIRKDITQQHFCDLTSVSLLEKCTRFHIHCAAVLVEEDLAVFDSKINDENLSKCIQSLKDFYHDLQLQGVTCPNEAEFREYDILLNLSDSDILREIKHLRREIRDSNEVKFAVSAHFALTSNNFPLFFKLVGQATYLNACLMHRYFIPVRVNAIKLLRKSYTIPNQTETYPLDLLMRQLGFDDMEQLKTFLNQMDVEYDETAVLLTRARFLDTPSIPPIRSKLVERKRIGSIGEVVQGGPLPSNPYREFPLHSSFDLKGALKPDARTAADQQKTSDFLKSEESHLQAVSGDKIFSLASSSSSSLPFFSQVNQSSTSTSTPAAAGDVVGFSFLQTQKLQLEQQKRQQEIQQQQVLNERKQQLIAGFCNEQVEQIVKLVTQEIVRSLVTDAVKSLKREKVSSIVANSFIDEFIRDTASQVHIQAHEQLLIKLKEQKLSQVSQILADELYGKFITAIILGLSQTVHKEALTKYISLNSGLLSRHLVGKVTSEMIRDASVEAYKRAIDERELKVNQLSQTRRMRLALKSFKHWLNIYRKNKYRRHIMATFPASNIETASETLVTSVARGPSLKRSKSANATTTTTTTFTTSVKGNRSNNNNSDNMGHNLYDENDDGDEDEGSPAAKKSFIQGSTGAVKCISVSRTNLSKLSLVEELELTQKNDVLSQLALLKAKIEEVKKDTRETKETIDLLAKSFEFVDHVESKQ